VHTKSSLQQGILPSGGTADHITRLWLSSCACSYPLTFTPPGSGSFSGSLELLVSTTGEKLLYTLVGKASEPLAEGHILVECQVSIVQEQHLLHC